MKDPNVPSKFPFPWGFRTKERDANLQNMFGQMVPELDIWDDVEP